MNLFKKGLSILMMFCVLAALPVVAAAEANTDEIDALIAQLEAEYGETADWLMNWDASDPEAAPAGAQPEEGDITQLEALRTAIEGIIAQYAIEVNDLSAFRPYFGFFSEENSRVWLVCFFAPDIEEEPYTVTIFADTGELQSIEFGSEG